MIHFILSTESGLSQIPALLRGEQDIPSDSSLGSKNYTRLASAIVLGAGYDDQQIDLLRSAAQGLKPIPWLRPDTSKPAPPLGPAYGAAMVARVKEALADLQAQNKMNDDAVVYF